MRESIIIFGLFCAGVLLGKTGLLPASITGSDAANWALYAMLAAVGMGLGFDSRAWRILRELKGLVLLIPCMICLGTLAGTLVAWSLLDMSLRDVLAVASGLGYYSLSSMLINRLADASLGSITLISNLFRELSALLLAPLFVRLCGGLGPLSAAASAADTCLPVILKTSGEHNAIIAIFSSMVLTVAVPLFISAIFAWM